MAAATAPAPVPLERVTVGLGTVDVHLWRAVQLERYVDVDALLRADAPAEPPYWMHLWPGAVALARRVTAAADIGCGTRVVELGCGLGLPALAAARRGAAVVACDWQHAPLAVVARSAADNATPIACLQMDWGAPALRGGFDLCLGADIGYDRNGASVLAGALRALVSARGAVWLADSVNTTRPELAERLGAEGFAVRASEQREEEDGRPVWVRVLEARRR